MSAWPLAYLALADGSVFAGTAWGAPGVAAGEVVFTTGMTGYQEVVTDPSYCVQIVTLTAPHIGNTGVNSEDPESPDGHPQVAGLVVRAPSFVPSNWRSQETLNDYLMRHRVVAIGGVDTRLLTRVLRDRGAQNGSIGTLDPDTLVDHARAIPPMRGLDLVRRVTPRQSYEFRESRADWAVPFAGADLFRDSGRRPLRWHVVALDLGAKRNILRSLVDVGCRVTAVPADTPAEDILALRPDGVLLSNGPGDPAAVGYAIDTIRALLGRCPIFGICLGHQLLALALGGRTYKLKFGHRGLNQPVKDLATGKIEITSQNHGFVVDVASLSGRAVTTHLHLNDGTSEGLSVGEARAFSVQYHPEAAAGPHDALYLFERFTELMGAG